MLRECGCVAPKVSSWPLDEGPGVWLVCAALSGLRPWATWFFGQKTGRRVYDGRTWVALLISGTITRVEVGFVMV